MRITALLSPERIICAAEVSSRKRAFEHLAEMLAQAHPNLNTATVLEALTNREKLGSTTVGNGVALPHTCLPITQAIGALLCLREGIKMDTPDKKPVQLFMAILVPENAAMEFPPFITELTNILLSKTVLEGLRQQTDAKAILAYLDGLFEPPTPYYPTALAA